METKQNTTNLIDEVNNRLHRNRYDLQSNRTKDITMQLDHWPTPEEAEELGRMATGGKYSHWGVFILRGKICLYLGLSCHCTHNLNWPKGARLIENVKACGLNCNVSEQRSKIERRSA